MKYTHEKTGRTYDIKHRVFAEPGKDQGCVEFYVVTDHIEKITPFTKVAKVEWKRVVAELKSLDMLWRRLRVAGSYCLSYARWRSADEIVSAEGQTVQ